MNKRFMAAAAVAAVLLSGIGSFSIMAADLTLVIASNATDSTNPYSIGLDKFKETAEELSQGGIEVIVHKGTLGENESELVEKLSMGNVDMVVASPGFMTGIGVPEIDIFCLEYLFNSFDHWEACVDGEFGDAMRDILLEKSDSQYRIMGYWTSSVRNIYAKQAVTKPEDLKGLSIRTQSSLVQQEFFKACGAIPTTLAWADLYQALNQGVVDGAENDYTNLMLKGHHKTANGKYISETQHDYTTRLFLMDGHRYDALSDEQKDWISQACEAATEEERKVTNEMSENSKQKAIEEGAVVTAYSDVDIDAFKKIAIPIQDAFAKQYNMTKELELVRQAAG